MPKTALIIKVRVKDDSGMNEAAGFYDALDEEVAELLQNATRRTQANSRKTVYARDV